MPTLTAREIFTREYGNSRNFLTDHRIRLGKLNVTTAYELSYGRGLFDAYLYGVSIAQVDPATGKTTRSPAGYPARSFTTLEDAKDYIARLKRGPVFDNDE